MTKYRALIVDDSQLMRQLLGVSVARMRQLELDEADDGLSAVKMLSTKQYDLLIADINMPIMDGLKLVKHVRNDERHKNIPIIIISTEGQSQDIERAKKLGVELYLTKPITGFQITDAITKLLNL